MVIAGENERRSGGGGGEGEGDWGEELLPLSLLLFSFFSLPFAPAL